MDNHNLLDMNRLLGDDLSKSRPVFHCEADFQHAMAWRIHELFPDCKVRLEFKSGLKRERNYTDIWIETENGNIAIELKYKTRKLSTKSHGEYFELLDQSAQDTGRYDFLKDVQRLEKLVKRHANTKAFAIILTNDRTYWKPPLRTDTVDAAFRLHEGKMATGALDWSAEASQGTKKGRSKIIRLRSAYVFKWRDFGLSNEAGAWSQFRYLLIDVPMPDQPSKA